MIPKPDRSGESGQGNQATATVSLLAAGFLLVLAALLKARSTALSWPFMSRDALGIALAVPFAEATVGVWLLVSRSSRALWLVAIATFLAFTIFQVYHFVLGSQYCPCLGGMIVKKWKLLALDGGMLIWLVTSAISLWPRLPWLVPEGTRAIAISVCLAALGMAVGLGSTLAEPSPGAALIVNREIGTLRPGEVRRMAVGVWNRSSKPVRILGCQKSCAVRCSGTLPMELSARSTGAIQLEIRGGLPNTRTIVPLLLFTDQHRGFMTKVELVGQTTGLGTSSSAAGVSSVELSPVSVR